jgi:hypothetical protein
VTRHEQDALVRPLLPDPGGELNAVQPRHDHIDEKQVHPTLGEMEGAQGFLTVLGLQNAITRLAEDAIRYPTSKPLVINDQDGGGGPGKRDRQLDLVSRGGPTDQSTLVSTVRQVIQITTQG